jgi:predicted ATP-grasp superfamily ATP-dependent carboligase
MIYNGIANFPARIYANEDIRVAFLISELNLNESMYYAVSKTILQLARENECGLVISSGSIFTEESKNLPANMICKGYTVWQAQKEPKIK